jgi:Glycosyltransferase family 87
MTLFPISRRDLVLPGLLVIVAVQVFINFHTWLISGPDHLYYLRGLNDHPLPYIDARIEYPVLTGVFMTVSAALTHGIQGYLRLNSVLLGACALGCTCTLWSISRRAACAFALSPLLLVYSLANWDMFAILLMLLGWRAYLRNRYASAGVWLALGVFAKFFPIFLLAACFLELTKRWRTDRDRTARISLYRFGAAAVTASAVVNLPFAIPAFHNWIWFWVFNDRRTGHAGLLSWLHLLSGASTSTMNLVLATIVLIAAVAAAVAIWRGTSVAHATAIAFLVFMVMEKVYSPQYTLWVFVYALLAGWDLWALVALSLIGLVDDANAAVHIAIAHANAPNLLRWDIRKILPREQGFRLLGLIVIGGAMLAGRLLRVSHLYGQRPLSTKPSDDRSSVTAHA